METAHAADLIRIAVDSNTPQSWADLGCGAGTFTYALADLLPKESCIYAVDSVMQNLASSRNGIEIFFEKADFEKDDLQLPGLNGIMMANALHFIKEKPAFINKMERNFRGNKQLLIVEYDTTSANRWVPFPINFNNLKTLLIKAGYNTIEKLGERISLYGGKMYAALAH